MIFTGAFLLPWTSAPIEMALQPDAAVGDMGGDAGLVELDEKKRIIQEFVPGKQVTLAHVIANPTEDLYAKLGLIDAEGSIGIMTITPSEGAMIAADVAAKGANVAIGFVDRFNGSLVITGDVAAVEAALKDVMRVLCDMMGFSPASISKT